MCTNEKANGGAADEKVGALRVRLWIAAAEDFGLERRLEEEQ